MWRSTSTACWVDQRIYLFITSPCCVGSFYARTKEKTVEIKVLNCILRNTEPCSHNLCSMDAEFPFFTRWCSLWKMLVCINCTSLVPLEEERLLILSLGFSESMTFASRTISSTPVLERVGFVSLTLLAIAVHTVEPFSSSHHGIRNLFMGWRKLLVKMSVLKVPIFWALLESDTDSHKHLNHNTSHQQVW